VACDDHQVTRSSRTKGCIRSEAGDTLIEVLVAVVVLAFCVVGLLGALTTSITSSSEHRSLASDDTVLRSFAEAAKYDIQLAPGALYQNCATTYATNPATAYRVVNAYPSSGPVGTALTVFGTDFTPRTASVIFLPGISNTTLTTALTAGQSGVTSLAVTSLSAAIASGELITIGSGSTIQTVTAAAVAAFGATSISVQSFTSTYAQPVGSTVFGAAATLSTVAPVRSDGTVSATASVPVMPAGSYPVVLWDGSNSAPSATNFSVTSHLGALSPGSGPTGTSVTVPVSGFKANATLSVMVGAQSSTPSSGGTTGNNGSSTVVFSIPTGLMMGTSYPVVISDTANNSATSTFTVATSPGVVATAAPLPSSAVSGVTLGISKIQWWNSSSLHWDAPPTTCAANDQSDIQQITLTATDVNGVADTLSFIVTNPNQSPPHPAPTFAVTSSPTNPVYLQTSTLTFSATLTGSNPNPTPVAPTGTITWVLTLNGASVSPSSCSSLFPQHGTNYSTATCTVSSPGPGVYQLTGNYAGDGNYSATAGYATATVAPSTPTLTVSVSPSNPTPAQTMTFSATVAGPSNGPTPTGTVQVVFTSAPGTAPTCGPSSLSGSGYSATTTAATDCAVANSQAGTYQFTTTYSGDGNYETVAQTGSVTVAWPAMTVTSVTSTNATGNTAGKAAKGDTISVTFSQPLSASAISSLGSTGTLTLCDRTSCGITQGSHTAISITQLATNSPINSVYWSSGHTGTAPGTFTFSNSNQTVTFTLTANPSGSGSVNTGSSASFTFTPLASITDTNGTAASGSYTTTVQLF